MNAVPQQGLRELSGCEMGVLAAQRVKEDVMQTLARPDLRAEQ